MREKPFVVGVLVRSFLRRGKFAARLLDNHSDTRLDRNFLTIGTGDTSFGKVALDLGDKAQVWAGSLRHVGRGSHA